MSETASSSRPSRHLPVSREPLPGNADGSSYDSTPSTADRREPLQDDQPTIISHEPPIAAPAGSGSVNRILKGDIVPGDRLGHFELVEYVGGGGMGRVFRAIDTRLARPVALKILTTDQSTDEESLLRFRNEAQSAARLNHDNIARVHHVGEDHGLNYIVFEFIEGENIRRLVERKGPLPLSEAVSYVLQVADALTHAAERDVVHRDIKPSNLLITPDGHVKVIDMGLARFRRVDAAAADLTASGVTLGTFDYISPEQARDPRNADVRSDIYSLGCTFFYMLSGRPPFPEGTVLQKLLQHQGDQPPDIRAFRPRLTEEAARVLRKMLAKDPRNRYSDPKELVDDLMVLAEHIGLRPIGPGGKILVAPHPPKVRFLQRHFPWIAPIAALVLIVGVLHFSWSSSARQDEHFLPPLSSPATHTTDGPEETPGGAPVLAQGPGPEASPDDPGGESPGVTFRSLTAPPNHGADTISNPSDDPSGSANTEPPEPGSISPAKLPVGLDPDMRHVADDPNEGSLRFDPTAAGFSAAEGASHALTAGGAEKPAVVLTGATGAIVMPGEVGPAVEPVPSRNGLLVVGDSAEGEKAYTTLGAACGAAVNGDVIELRYNGPREERPVKLANVKLTIRAGKDYRPVVVFRPNEIDPFKSARGMFTVTSGRLTLINVALQLHVPEDVPADNWSLFEVQDGQTIHLERCWLTIHNVRDQQAAYQPEVVFFLAKPAPAAELAMGNGHAAATPVTTIELADCIVRGKADLLRSTDLQPIHLDWENGLLVTNKRLLSSTGGKQAPPRAIRFKVDLRHLTAVLHGGLCRLSESEAAPHQLAVDINCADSILVGQSGAALIEQSGIGGESEFRQRIGWFGDRNFYEHFDQFWSIIGIDRTALSAPMDFDGWQTYWGSEDENLPLCDAVQWRQPPEVGRLMSVHVPADYVLDDSSSDNPAIGAASDGRDAGVQFDRLPEAPPAGE